MTEQTSEVQGGESRLHRLVLTVVVSAIVLLGPAYILLVIFWPKPVLN